MKLVKKTMKISTNIINQHFIKFLHTSAIKKKIIENFFEVIKCGSHANKEEFNLDTEISKQYEKS